MEEVYAYDAGNHLTKLTRNGKDVSFQYDRAGNLVKDDQASYTYDALNRNTRVETFDGNIQINHYDAEGLRHEMDENGKLVQFIFNPAKEVVTETEDRTVLRYIRDSKLIARNTDAVRTYYHYASDEMGSITHVTDEEGNLINCYEYDAWGNLTLEEEQVSNRFKYTGEQFDAITQQYYLRARFYNPVLARFMQEDTYRGDGLNLYAYCANNPVRYVDPSGHWCDKKENIYKDLVRKNGLDINSLDPDTKLRLMAEASNIEKGLDVGRNDTVIELPGSVSPEQNRPLEPVADRPNDGRRGEGGSYSDDVIQYEKLKLQYATDEIYNAERVGSALKDDPTHRAASYLSKDQLANGRTYSFTGGDNKSYTVLQTKGQLDGVDGIFEYVTNDIGQVTHQRFVKGGIYTGFPNQSVPKGGY